MPSRLALFLAVFVTFTSANQFIEPPPPTPSSSLPIYAINTPINITWSTTYPFFDLIIVPKSLDTTGELVSNFLILPNATTQTNISASLTSLPVTLGYYYFTIFSVNATTGEPTSFFSSTDFYLVEDLPKTITLPPQAPTYIGPAITPSSSRGINLGGMPADANAPSPTGTSTVSSTSHLANVDEGGLSESTRIGLGVGLTIGLSLLTAFVAAVTVRVVRFLERKKDMTGLNGGKPGPSELGGEVKQ